MIFTFSSIRSALIKVYSKLSNWSVDLMSIDPITIIIDVISYASQWLVYKVEFYFKESVWKTAALRSSLVAQSYILNYYPYRKKASTGFIKVSGDGSFALPYSVYQNDSVFIPRWTKVSDEDGDFQAYTTKAVTYYQYTEIIHKKLPIGGIVINSSDGNNVISISGFTNHNFKIGSVVSIRNSRLYNGDFIVHWKTSTNVLYLETIFRGNEIFTGSELISTGDIYIPIKEGLPKDYLYTFKGEINETIRLFMDDIENDEFEILLVDNNQNILETFKITNDLNIVNDYLILHCQIENSIDMQSVIIKFGDGIYSRKPLANQKILIRFASTKGKDSVLNKMNSIVRFKDTILDAVGNKAKIFITNDSFILGGTDIEDIESIRSNARNLYVSGFRAGSRNDWKTIIQTYPTVQRVNVWTDRDINPYSNNSSSALVYVSGLSIYGKNLPPEDQDTINKTLLEDTKSLTDAVEWLPLKLIYARFICKAKVQPFPFNDIEFSIKTDLYDRYNILKMEFKESIYNSNYTRILDSNSKIIYHNTEVYHYQKSEDFSEISFGGYVIIPVSRTEVEEPSSGGTQIASLRRQIYLQNGTVEIWLRRKIDGIWYSSKRVAKCDAVNDTIIVGDNGYTAIGLITYTTNQITYSVQNIGDYLTYPLPADEPDVIDPLLNPIDLLNPLWTPFGVLNPKDSDLTGYVIRVAYKTKSGTNITTLPNAEFLNDIRLPNFDLLAGFDTEDDMSFKSDFIL